MSIININLSEANYKSDKRLLLNSASIPIIYAFFSTQIYSNFSLLSIYK